MTEQIFKYWRSAPNRAAGFSFAVEIIQFLTTKFFIPGTVELCATVENNHIGLSLKGTADDITGIAMEFEAVAMDEAYERQPELVEEKVNGQLSGRVVHAHAAIRNEISTAFFFLTSRPQP